MSSEIVGEEFADFQTPMLEAAVGALGVIDYREIPVALRKIRLHNLRALHWQSPDAGSCRS